MRLSSGLRTQTKAGAVEKLQRERSNTAKPAHMITLTQASSPKPYLAGTFRLALRIHHHHHLAGTKNALILTILRRVVQWYGRTMAYY